jgi:DNA mismatch repair ATPase MutS
MMDEIFHSTNADDGVAASKVFMERLYGQPGVVSLISTHYKELALMFAEKVQTLQLQAFSEPSGRLTYTYKVVPGISDKSSVMEILTERGLLISDTAVAPTK